MPHYNRLAAQSEYLLSTELIWRCWVLNELHSLVSINQ